MVHNTGKENIWPSSAIKSFRHKFIQIHSFAEMNQDRRTEYAPIRHRKDRFDNVPLHIFIFQSLISFIIAAKSEYLKNQLNATPVQSLPQIAFQYLNKKLPPNAKMFSFWNALKTKLTLRNDANALTEETRIFSYQFRKNIQ